MIEGWIIITAALAYVGFLFAVAYWGDRHARQNTRRAVRGRPTIYALSLAAYCTSWTFFGSVGLSASTGFDFLPVYIGPILMLTLGYPLIRRIIRLAKTQNITSVADFLAARYGKSAPLAAIAAIIIVIGTLPYISLQLKAVSESVTTMLGPNAPAAGSSGSLAPLGDIAFIIAMAMAVFAILFGTRHIDATEHQEGLILAVATESVVKLGAFLLVGGYITFVIAGGVGPLVEQVTANPGISELFTRGFNGSKWLAITFLSLVCIILLPRQFHVMVVENNASRELKRASWLFPLYLVLINLFVVPVAMAGLLSFGNDKVSGDMFLLALPLAADAPAISMIAFLGGLSAATAMVIVASVALAIMICNDLVTPILLHRRHLDSAAWPDMGSVLLNIRRGAIVAVLICAYAFYRLVGDSFPLASIGLLSFAAIAQLAPAFFGGLLWRRATAGGAMAGVIAGFSVWLYTLLVPAFVKSGLIAPGILESGPLGLGLLRPQMLFNMHLDPLSHGLAWSLTANIIAYIGVSLLRAPEPIERLQARAFINEDWRHAPAPRFRPWRSSVGIADLRETVGRYLGEDRAMRAFAEYAENRQIRLDETAMADAHCIRFAERLLASAIGAASSRLVLSLILTRNDLGSHAALRLLDDASEAIQYNRDLLQKALDQVRQGIAVFDRDMQLICWNRQFRDILHLPGEYVRIGVPLDQIIRAIAEQSLPASGEAGELGRLTKLDAIVADRLRKYAITMETIQERLGDGRQVVEIRTNAMPQGGIVTAFTDITDRVAAADALARAKETLERRVRERTAELTKLNAALREAKARADEANLDKTRFLAAASHDILQPLHAARLYTTSLRERPLDLGAGQIAANIDASLGAVEEILGTLLDISRLDTGVMRPQITAFALEPLLCQLKLEFEPMAKEKGLTLTVMPSRLWVCSDRRLLRRMLQNLLSNAIKYTREGRVLIGCRRRGDMVSVETYDTGPGIPQAQQSIVFKEFQRLEQDEGTVRGLGLGLSIVERIGRVLGHPIRLHSVPGQGSMFAVSLPRAISGSALAPAPAPLSEPGRELAGCRVVCIDNEPAILDGMVMLLRGWGCQVIAAPSTEAALGALCEGQRGNTMPSAGSGADGQGRVPPEEGASAEAGVPATVPPHMIPDIILADYHLDHGTGCDAIAQIRTACATDIPGVIITADGSAEIAEAITAAGYRILRKPLKPASLRALLTRIIPPARAAAE